MHVFLVSKGTTTEMECWGKAAMIMEPHLLQPLCKSLSADGICAFNLEHPNQQATNILLYYAACSPEKLAAFKTTQKSTYFTDLWYNPIVIIIAFILYHLKFRIVANPNLNQLG